MFTIESHNMGGWLHRAEKTLAEGMISSRLLGEPLLGLRYNGRTLDPHGVDARGTAGLTTAYPTGDPAFASTGTSTGASIGFSSAASIATPTPRSCHNR